MRDIEFESKGIRLPATIYEASGSKVGLLFFGGGLSTPHKLSYYPEFQEKVLASGVSSMTFDFRGYETTPIPLNDTTLDTRLEDASAAAKAFMTLLNLDRLVLAGVSMGAPIAIRLAEAIEVSGLVLVSPAAYSLNARDKNFGPAFKEAIIGPQWIGSPEFDALEGFTGSILLAFGEKDEVIPKEIINEYQEIVRAKKGTTIKLGETEHSFMRLDDERSRLSRAEFYAGLKLFLANA